jgi:rod shape-determining protein MreC
MRGWKESRYTNIVFFMLLALGFIFIIIRLTPPIKLIKNFIYYVSYPNLSVANQIFQTAGNFAQNIKAIVYVRQENIFYRQKNQELIDKLRNYNEMKELLDRLTRLLSVQKIKDTKSVFAQITAREPGEWYQWFIINKGLNDGLYNELPVTVTTGGTDLCAVGRIIETKSSSAKVALITNILSSVAVRIKGKNIDCLAQGVNSNLITISYIPIYAHAAVGDEIEISPLSEVFPQGMPVGKIISVSNEKSADFQTAVAEVFFEADSLYEAVILLPSENGK